MKQILLISPHFDDAVLSAGQFMADRPDAEVVTIFAGSPPNATGIATPYDEKCGFPNAYVAVRERIRENDEALALLEAKAINLGFPDGQYGVEVPESAITEALQNIVDMNDYEFIMAPLGIGHPDHLLVSEAVRKLKFERQIYLWEDLPLRVVEPWLVFERAQDLDLMMNLMMKPATTGDKMAKKIRSMLCYKSQVNTGILDPYLMYVPERFWRLR